MSVRDAGRHIDNTATSGCERWMLSACGPSRHYWHDNHRSTSIVARGPAESARRLRKSNDDDDDDDNGCIEW